MNNIYFTICVPTYNRSQRIIRTLDSIRKQSFTFYEVLIIDDGSNDGTIDIINNYINNYNLKNNFKYYYKNNGGKHTALNMGIDKAVGKFFVILDSDDFLIDDALEKIYKHCKKIENDDKFSGIMGKSVDYLSGEIIGELFEESKNISSYIDYHYLTGTKHHYQDCFEANKTILLKPYRFPENIYTKFVPEAWLFDQIGLSYNLLLTNECFKNVEYLDDGITKDCKFKVKNNIGFLYLTILRLDKIILNLPTNIFNKIKWYTYSWWAYWNEIKIDKEKNGPRIKKVTFYGNVVKIFSPVITFLYSLCRH